MTMTKAQLLNRYAQLYRDFQSGLVPDPDVAEELLALEHLMDTMSEDDDWWGQPTYEDEVPFESPPVTFEEDEEDDDPLELENGRLKPKAEAKPVEDSKPKVEDLGVVWARGKAQKNRKR